MVLQLALVRFHDVAAHYDISGETPGDSNTVGQETVVQFDAQNGPAEKL